MRSRLLPPLLASAVLLGGCGQDAPVSAAAGAALTADVVRLKAAATSGTSADVARAAERLRADVATQLAQGELTSTRAAVVLDQLARVLADAAARPAPRPTASPTPTAHDVHRKRKGKGEH